MVSMDDDADDDDVDDDVVILVESDDIAYKTLLTEGSATPGTESSIQVCFGRRPRVRSKGDTALHRNIRDNAAPSRHAFTALPRIIP